MKVRSLVLSAWCALTAVALSGCNGIGGKEHLVARFNDESVYKEDLVLLKMNSAKSHKFWDENVYTELLSKAAVASIAYKEFPEIEDEWNQYFKDIESRILMMVLQRYYVSECMMFSDSELRRFYEANKNLFPNDSTGDFYSVRGEVAGQYYLSKHQEEFEAYAADVAKNQNGTIDSAVVKKQFVDLKRQVLREDFANNIIEKQHLSVQSLPAVDAKPYYEKHKEEYKTAPGYVLYHIQMADSAALASKVKDNLSLEEFKTLAASLNQNKYTAKDSGLVGHVKQGFALPYGIGMIEGLDKALEGKNSGFVSPVFHTEKDASFQRFFLAENVASQTKPFERVEKSIKNDIANGDVLDVDSSFALIVKDGKTLFTEGDLLRFNKLYFGGHNINMPIHERMVNMVAESFAYADAALEHKLNLNWEYKAVLRNTRWNYIFDRYVEKTRVAKAVPEDTLKSMYDRFGSPIHRDYDFEQAKDDLRLVASFPKNMYLHDYFMGYRVIYYGLTYDQSVPRIFYHRNKEMEMARTKRLAAEAYTKASAHFYGDDVPEYNVPTIVDKMMAKADSLYKAGKRSEAYYAYREVMYTYPDNDSLFQKVAYEMAQIQNENEEYLDAEGEYYAFYRMWPESENAEKAMFSRGFILTENLGMDSVALEVFREFQVKYPNSELKESADWLVKNIESNGKLAEDLLQKINTEQ
ncbi:MAG: hypothetical protein MJZ25_14445 [Fibrobacter sp.]|nr:hypothetical protein [Fibrobacter sp.]